MTSENVWRSKCGDQSADAQVISRRTHEWFVARLGRKKEESVGCGAQVLGRVSYADVEDNCRQSRDGDDAGGLSRLQ